MNQPLFGLRPGLGLAFDEQRKNLDLAFDGYAVLVNQLLVSKKADGLRSDFPPDARFLKGFTRCRLRRFQPLDRPSFGNDRS